MSGAGRGTMSSSSPRQQRFRSWDGTDHPYRTRTAALATKHGKLALIAPPLEESVGLRVEAVEVDTDSLGTFTGEIPRLGTPLETAIAKARLGMSVSGHTLGLASEGSIGPDPAMPFVNSDREIVVLVDDESGITIWESHASWEIVAVSDNVSAEQDIGGLLARAGFPQHQLIVRPSSGPISPIYKGVSSLDELTAAIAACASASPDGLARVESDLRAHACPSRRVVIAAAAQRLASRVASRCPACRAPGWGRTDVLFGVPCSQCGTQVDRPRAEIDGCVTCEHREIRPLAAAELGADPGECPYCNP